MIFDRLFLLPLFWATGLGLLGCQDTRLAGGGTETGNTEIVSGRILDASGRGLSASQIDLSEVRPQLDGSDSGSSFTVYTDTAGNFRFKAIHPGHYALYAPGRGEAPTPAILTRLEKTDSALSVSPLVTDEPINLMGRVFIPPAMNMKDVQICMPGLRTCVQPDSDRVYRFATAPRGSYELLFLTPTATHYLAFKLPSGADIHTTLRDVVLADSADASHIPYRFYDLKANRSFSMVPITYAKGQEPDWYRGKSMDKVTYFLLKPKVDPIFWNPDYLAQWPYSRIWTGDSLINAPDLDQPLFGFPMPVRLVTANFNFSEAHDDGGDLVFSDGRGNILAHQIERWDPVAGHAEIWVRFDSLAAAKINRKLVLHWGRPATVSAGNGSAVFQNQNGFLGAWHMTGSLPDDKAHEARGISPGTFSGGLTPSELSLMQSQLGPVAKAFAFARTGGYVQIPFQSILEVTETFTLAIWARLNQPDTTVKRVLASKWQTGKREWHFHLQPDRKLELEFGDASGNILGSWRSLTPVANPTQWHHYAATFDKGIVHLFVDGIETAGSVGAGSVPVAIHPFKSDIHIGSNSIDMSLNWQGDLDELQYYSEAKSKAWIEMLYRTQKAQP